MVLPSFRRALAAPSSLLLFLVLLGSSFLVAVRGQTTTTTTTTTKTAATTTTSTSTTASTAATYTAFDDMSWAINEQRVSSTMLGRQRDLYNTFLHECAQLIGSQYCQDQEYWRMQMNMYQPRSMVNYSSTGFMKTRVPDRLFHKLHNFWQENRNEGVEEWPERVSTYQNTWTIPTQIVKVDNRTLPGGGPAFAAHIASTLREVVESWTGMRMATTSTYGIRVYQNGSILAPHVDRLPLVTSIIVNVDQDVNDPWPLEVYDHDGVAQNVTLLPGEMLLYESHSVIHGRPFPLNGSYFANLFVHFEPIAPLHAKPSDVRIHQYFPPYIVPGSSWEVEWRETNPRGWPLFREPWTLIERGDLSTLQFLAQADPSRRLWNVSDDHGQQLLYHACLHGHLDIVAFLVEHGVDVNHIAATTGQTALSVSDAVWGPDSAISQYLRGHGAVLDPHMLLQNRGFGGGATRNRTAEWTEL